MRAAQLNPANYVINYAEVNGYGGMFIDPLDSVLGAYWNGTSFENPIPPVPPPPDNTPIVTESFNASLRRKAVELEAEGKTFEAVQLLLQAQGVQQ